MIININKEKNYTSRDICNIIGKKLKTRKVGHTGTLDPLATGVLIICTDESTKLVDLLTSKDKEYLTTLKLGIETNTLDITGNIINEKSYIPSQEEVINALNSFLGNSTQIPPLYSAIKVNGKKLYEYARKNEIVNIPTRDITVYNIKLLSYDYPYITFTIHVSKGTYIRSIIRDLGYKLNTYATMTELTRTKQGKFTLENSNSLKEFLNDNYQTISLTDVLDYPIINLTEEEYRLVKNGNYIFLNTQEKYVTLKYKNQVIAIYYRKKDLYYPYKMLQII